MLVQSIYTVQSGYTAIRMRGRKPPEGAEIWWRADDMRYANYDQWAECDQPSGSHLALELTPYIVVKHTPKGVRLRGWLGDEFFVLGSAIRQKAVPTIELAIQDLIARKKRHVQGAQARLRQAEAHLAAAEQWLQKHRAMEGSHG